MFSRLWERLTGRPWTTGRSLRTELEAELMEEARRARRYEWWQATCHLCSWSSYAATEEEAWAVGQEHTVLAHPQALIKKGLALTA